MKKQLLLLKIFIFLIIFIFFGIGRISAQSVAFNTPSATNLAFGGGTGASFTASATGTAGGFYNTLYSMTFSIDGGSAISATISGSTGTATINTSALAAGSHTILVTAKYDFNGNTGISQTETQTYNFYVIVATGGSTCNPGTATLTATGAPSGGTYEWYAASTGGTALATGSSYTTPSISTTTTYYVDVAVSGNENNRSAAIATVNNCVPTISYTATQTYTVATSVGIVSPTTGGGAVASFAYNTTAASSYTVGTNPWHLVFDASGNLYVANFGSNTVSKITTGGVVSTFISTNLSSPAGIAIDGSGNFYVVNYNGGSNGSVTKYNSSGTYQSTIITGGQATGIAIDASGNIWLADYTNGLEEFSSTGTLLQTVTTNVSGARGVFIDVSGNIYVSNQGSNRISKYNSAGSYLSIPITGLNVPYGVYVDGSGNIYATNGSGNSVAIATSAGTAISTFSGTGISTPTDARTDATGNLYVSNFGNNTVKKYAPTGGYFINKPLPPGLSFNYLNGQITGTPTTVYPATSYTVTAYDASGAGTSNIFTITVNAAPIPNISYTSPAPYPVGTAITPLAPVNTGGAAGAYGTLTQVQSISNSNGIAINPSTGYRYITSSSGNSLSIYNSSGTLISTESGTTYNYNTPAGVVVNAAGTTFVANRGAGTLVEVTSASVVTTISGFVEPTGVVLDAAGNIYVVDRNSSGGTGAGVIYKIAAGTNTPVAYITGLSDPWGITIDNSGNLYISEPGPGNSINTIFKVASGSTTPVSFVSSGLSSPRSMVVDGAGNIFETDAGSNLINEISSTGTIINTFTQADSPTGIAIDGSGDLFTTGYNYGEIYESVASGYTISAALPAGLYFNKSNGVITGTPTTPTAATNYTVTATNSGGTATSNVFTLSVKPVAPAVSSTGPVCSGNSITLTASGGLPAGGTYNFYADAAGTVLLQSSTGITYTTTLSATTSFYVSYTAPSPASTTSSLTTVTSTVNPEPVLSTTATGSGYTFSYPFSGNTNDASSAGNNGAIYTSGVTLTTDRYNAANSAYAFSGTNETGSSGYIYTTAAAATAPTNFTINIWFKTTTAGGLLIGFGSVQNNGNSGNHDRNIYMTGSGQIVFGIYNSTTALADTLCTPSGTNYADGNWHMATAILSSTAGMSLYVDGKEKSANAGYTTAQTGYSGYWRIGEDNTYGWPGATANYAYTGSLDDIFVYAGAGSPAGIYSAYGAGSPAVCLGSPLGLQANTVSGATYSWTGPNGFTSNLQNPTVTASCSASTVSAPYVLTVTGSNGCTYTQNVYGTINAVPANSVFNSPASVAVSTGAVISLTSPVAGISYSWDFGGGTPSTGTGNGPFTVQWATMGAKTITLTATNATGCSTVSTQSVLVGATSVSVGNYAFSQPIVLNTSAAGISSTLSNFPALVYIQENALIGKSLTSCTNIIQNPAGGTTTYNYDFAFTEPGVSGTNELFYQVESFNSTTGTLLAWVNVPSVTGTNTSLTFYFGSASTAAIHTSAFAQATWGSDYKAVYHFDEGSATASVIDATSNGNTGTPTNTAVANGEARSAAGVTSYGAYSFNGNGSIAVSGGINIPNAFTLSAWVNLASSHDQKVMTNQTSAGTGGYKLGVYSTNIAESESNSALDRATFGYGPTGPTLGTGSWHYLQAVFSGTQLSTYVDGKQYQILATTTNSAGTNPFYIGVGEGGNNLYWYGNISEARVISSAKTTDWIAMEYYNQSNPTTFSLENPVITPYGGLGTNAAAIGGSITYTWTGASSSDPTNAANWLCYDATTSTGSYTSGSTLQQLPDYTGGTSNLNIPASTPSPTFPSGTSTYNAYTVTLGSGSQLYLNGNTLQVGCHVYNTGAGTGTISSGSGSSSTVTPTTTGGLTFNGSGALSGQVQNLYGSASSAVNLANLTEANASGTGSLNITGGPVNVYSTFGSTSGNITVAASSTLTLISTAAGSANVDKVLSGNSISGNVTVQRYIPGGTGYRNYRLITLPVNTSGTVLNQSTTEGYIDLHSLNAGILTAGVGPGAYSYSTATTNPLAYLYDESRAQNFTAFVAGKNVGIYSWAGATAITTTTPNTPAYNVITYGTTLGATKTTAQVPVGNSIQLYYVGPNTAANLTATAPLAATSLVTGYLNQGSIAMYIYNHSNKYLSFTSGGNNTATPAIVGFNQVGNPYASTIDLDSLFYDNRGPSPYNTNISPTFWELKEPSNTFVGYNALSHTVSTAGSGAEAYIASGQGFYADALSTTSTLTFNENDKVNVQIGTSTTPVLLLNQKFRDPGPASAPDEEVLPDGLTGLHLQLSKDSSTYTQTGIYFNSAWSDKFFRYEDAVDLDGLSPKVYLSSYSSDGMRLCINQLSDYSKGKTVKLYASATTSGNYSISLADIKNIDAIYHVYLRDHKLNDSVDLRTAGSYSFTINTGDTTTYGARRFDLVLEREALPPYQLLTFAGQKVTAGVQLNWTSNNAGDYTGFVLQKQDANNVFNPIYSVQSNNGSTYTFVDTDPVLGANVYRLAQNDIDGKISYSSTVVIGYNDVSSNGYFSVYPNPATVILNVLINPAPSAVTNYTADIYSTSGVPLDHRVLNSLTWTEDISSYKEGVYIIVLKDTNGNVLGKAKFIKTK